MRRKLSFGGGVLVGMIISFGIVQGISTASGRGGGGGGGGRGGGGSGQAAKPIEVHHLGKMTMKEIAALKKNDWVSVQGPLKSFKRGKGVVIAKDPKQGDKGTEGNHFVVQIAKCLVKTSQPGATTKVGGDQDKQQGREGGGRAR